MNKRGMFIAILSILVSGCSLMSRTFPGRESVDLPNTQETEIASKVNATLTAVARMPPNVNSDLQVTAVAPQTIVIDNKQMELSVTGLKRVKTFVASGTIETAKGIWLVVYMKVRNISTATHSFNGGTFFSPTLVDSTGRSYDHPYSGIEGLAYFFDDLPPTVSFQTALAFDIAADAKELQIKFSWWDPKSSKEVNASMMLPGQ